MAGKMQKPRTTFGVIGCGRFGALWASRLAEHGDVLVYDKRQGRAEHLTHDVDVQPVPLEAAAKSDILFIAVPISEFEGVCKELKSHLGPRTVVIDTCSVKVHPVKAMCKNFPKGQLTIGTHPLFGPDSVARLGMMGRKIVVCNGKSVPRVYARIIALLKKMGLRVIEATPEEHDRSMAASQALVHFIGRGLAGLNLKERTIVTPDYETLLRMQALVVNDTWQLFHDMQTYNPYTAKERKALIQSLQDVETKLKKRA